MVEVAGSVPAGMSFFHSVSSAPNDVKFRENISGWTPHFERRVIYPTKAGKEMIVVLDREGRESLHRARVELTSSQLNLISDRHWGVLGRTFHHPNRWILPTFGLSFAEHSSCTCWFNMQKYILHLIVCTCQHLEFILVNLLPFGILPCHILPSIFFIISEKDVRFKNSLQLERLPICSTLKVKKPLNLFFLLYRYIFLMSIYIWMWTLKLNDWSGDTMNHFLLPFPLPYSKEDQWSSIWTVDLTVL